MLADSTFALGCFIAIAGFWWIYPPLALIVGGGGLAYGSILAAKNGKGRNGNSR